MHDDFTWIGIMKGTATGASGAVQLAVTYGLMPRFALGLFFAGESVQGPRVEISGVKNDTVAVGFLGLAGLMGDLRLRAAPTGWHFQAGLCAARMTIKEKSSALPDKAPTGAGFAVAAGYDWAISDTWQFGLLARFLGARLSAQGTDHDVGALSALAVFSYR
jgi:hypothetical protein